MVPRVVKKKKMATESEDEKNYIAPSAEEVLNDTSAPTSANEAEVLPPPAPSTSDISGSLSPPRFDFIQVFMKLRLSEFMAPFLDNGVKCVDDLCDASLDDILDLCKDAGMKPMESSRLKKWFANSIHKYIQQFLAKVFFRHHTPS